MQQLTFPKFLILATATYFVVSGKSCEWFRSVRHALRHHFGPSHQQQGFHLRRHQNQPELEHHSQITHQDSSSSNSYASGIWFSKSIELIDDISTNDSSPTIELEFDQEHCQDDNDECHYELGDVVSIDYTLGDISLASDDETTTAAYVKGSFLINDKITWTFSCPLTDGKGCDHEMDERMLVHVTQDVDNNIKMGSLSFSLSPSTQDLVVVLPLVVKGNLHFYTNSQSQPNELLAQIGMDAIVA